MAPNHDNEDLKESKQRDVKCLWNKKDEHEACGVGFLVNVHGKASHKLLRDAETMSKRMEHRGACSCDNLTGDGAGVLTSIPHAFYQRETKLQGTDLPAAGSYATGLLFFAADTLRTAQEQFEACARQCGLKVLCWRAPPTNDSTLGAVAKGSEPVIWQVFVVEESSVDKALPSVKKLDFERKVFLLRKWSTHALLEAGLRFYICSLSSKIIVYKGQFTPPQLWSYYVDLQDPLFEVYLSLVHARFSTNTFPSWDRAHPLRLLAHNGEINTLRGNVNLMRAREGVMRSPLFGEDLSKLYPVVEPDMSDSGSVDNVLEFLLMAAEGRSLPEAVMTMVPEAWQNDNLMSDEKRAFYRWAACAMEPWDGPALLTFTDGRFVGAILDRNGLRPSRYYQTRDGLVCMASEVGVFDIAPRDIVHKGRLRPGRMLLIDTSVGEFARDDLLKSNMARGRPYADWLTKLDTLEAIRARAPPVKDDHWLQGSGEDHRRRLELFGYSRETLDMLLAPMAANGKEALGSMGNDAPLACLSNCQPLVYDYFKQLFAQVTNPPIDPFRERIVMSLACPVGPEGNILEPSEQQCTRLWLEQPLIAPKDLAALKSVYKATVIDAVFAVDDGDDQSLRKALENLCAKASDAIKKSGSTLLILSDRRAIEEPTKFAPIPSLLALGATHHHLINSRQRQLAALIVESGEVREVHHFAVLLGYGADGIVPYYALEALRRLWLAAQKESEETSTATSEALAQLPDENAIFKSYAKAVDTGLAKVMAKMGISTLQSYKGAQIFECVGMAAEVIDLCFKGTASRIGGVTFAELRREALQRHALAYSSAEAILRNVGQLHWRVGGEKHLNEPMAVAALQDAAKNNSRQAYKDFVKITRDANRNTTLRGQMDLVYAVESKQIPLCEVEPAVEIVKRFCTGAMSFGSISIEAHSALAVAMNRVKGKSNTGEGGEDEERFISEARSAIKQVASGRFGVTAAYLANADELQIKMAQGAKPGEGGELPGHKVSKDIAKTRHSVPGVGLISPPPHHDIYSIEDLAELIYDLKCANPVARISVKLVSEVGVGIVAAGVAKGKAEHITISGHDGGTGASSWTGIKGAGLPWELGLSETHQVLVANDLRSRVVLQVDGQLRSAFDVIVGACLGADEFAMSTAPLIVLGCTMMRKCHLNTCPVGVATQDPELRKKFEGQPEHVVNYLFLMAEEIREEMAKLGIRRIRDLIGRTDLLKFVPASPKASLLDLDAILCNAARLLPGGALPVLDQPLAQDFALERRKDVQLIERCRSLLDGDKPGTIEIDMDIGNCDRTFATTLSYEVAKRYGNAGLPDNKKIKINLKGSAGQSFAAFMAKGIEISLEGDANDYVGKGLSGGIISIFPPKELTDIEGSTYKSEENVIAGNVALYGATSGRAFIRGVVAERFCVRNSGAQAVVEGCGDHGCEYMTGGLVIVLGDTGRNFGAGMSGGIAYVLVNDQQDLFVSKCNLESIEVLPLVRKADINQVRSLLEEFVTQTRSLVAANLLALSPQDMATRFVKVYPTEYQAIIEPTLDADGKALLVETGADEVDRAIPKITTDIEDISKGGKVAKKPRLDKVRGFVKYKRIAGGLYRKAADRVGDWNEVYDVPRIRENVRTQASRCMECGVPFCQSGHGCPLGNLIPVWNDLVHAGRWREATQQLLATNNFPEFTGRVCPAPCEGACVLGINEDPVAIKSVELSISEVGFENGYIKAEAPAARTGRKVAVIGGGPAGMAAAAQLNSVGHTVTVYDRQPEIGGLLRYGIPSMKLDKGIVRRRVKLMEEEGITFKPGTDIGKDVSGQELLDKFDAICIATGATWPRDLPIEGRDTLKNIHFAMDYLGSTRPASLHAKGKKVVVIGGGDTGCDCIATALREGASSVVAFEILPEPPARRAGDTNPWPQWPKVFRIDYGHEEVRLRTGKDPRAYSISSKRFVGDTDGNVKGIDTVKVEWTEKDGRWNMTIVAGSEDHVEADLVLLAMGFLGPENYLLTQLGIKQDQRSNIVTGNEPSNGGTDYHADGKVFACGDCRRGQSLVVHAINEGRQCARAIDIFLGSQNNGPKGSTLPVTGGVMVPLTI